MGMQVINSKGKVSPYDKTDVGSRESAARFGEGTPTV